MVGSAATPAALGLIAAVASLEAQTPVTLTRSSLSSAIGLVACLSVTTALAQLDLRGSAPPRPTRGALVGTLQGMDHYRMVLAPTRNADGGGGERLVDGQGPLFRFDHLPTGLYRLSVITEADADLPSVWVPVSLGADLPATPPTASERAEIEAFLAAYAEASRQTDPMRVIEFFDPGYRGARGQNRDAKLAEIKVVLATFEPKSFQARMLDARVGGGRVVAVLEARHQATRRATHQTEPERTDRFVTELKRGVSGWKILRTETLPLPRLIDIDRVLPHALFDSSIANITITSGRTTTLPKPIAIPGL